MHVDDKNKKVENLIENLKKIADVSIEKGNYERAMAAISVASHVHYEYNQYYTDSDLERLVEEISHKKISGYEETLDAFEPDDNTVLFYDGFGLDTRGVAIIYLNALKKNGYKIIYVTDDRSIGKLPEITRIMQDADIIWEYISMKKNYTVWLESLMGVILKYSPKSMFFYTTPYDAAGAVGFCMLKDKAKRFLIDLTDHAFWLGTSCNDYFCGSREMSASNQYYKRNIPKDKLIKLGVNLLVDEGEEHGGLPFDVEKERYVFSGGSLYKTLGDFNNMYYRIVDAILEKHIDLKFLYAGTGDDSQMKVILNKYPERAFLIDERKDFYFLIKNCTLYLNTYPMFGGMMMKYSANAGKLPITLRHNADSDGLLINQKAAKIDYNTYEELIEDVDKLLSDENYLKQRQALLQGTVITEQRFVNNIRSLIENQCTDYEHAMIELDTSEFQKEYLERFDLKREKEMVVEYRNKSLFMCMPWMFWGVIKQIIRKIYRKMRKVFIKKV